MRRKEEKGEKGVKIEKKKRKNCEREGGKLETEVGKAIKRGEDLFFFFFFSFFFFLLSSNPGKGNISFLSSKAPSTHLQFIVWFIFLYLE